MTLSELFESLSYTYFANLAIGNEGEGSIIEQGQPKITRYVNDALTRLYSRFILIEKDVIIEMQDHITNYHLLLKFAESQWETSTQDFLYIKDLAREPFEEDVAKILEVYDSYGGKVPLNDSNQDHSVFTPQPNVLQVPRPMSGVALSVIYQAKHPKMTGDLDQEILLPEVLKDALESYVAYKQYSSLNTQEAQGVAQNHLSQYEAICQEVTQNDSVSTSRATTNERFHQRGWK